MKREIKIYVKDYKKLNINHLFLAQKRNQFDLIVGNAIGIEVKKASAIIKSSSERQRFLGQFDEYLKDARGDLYGLLYLFCGTKDELNHAHVKNAIEQIESNKKNQSMFDGFLMGWFTIFPGRQTK